MPPQALTHLVLVCCHATFRGGNPDLEASWILQAFQTSNQETGKVGEHHTFVQHIAAGALMMERDPDSLLMFSGGKTQPLVHLTEAVSYLRVALSKGYWNGEPHPRCAAETKATDSYQNLLFSIVRFRHLTGAYPLKVTIITHAFKDRRFLELHGPAIKYPANALRVFGISPPMTLAELQDVQHGEMVRGYAVFAKDLYGTREPLCSKRIARRWDSRVINALGDGLENEVHSLLDWTGGASGHDVFAEKLPWEEC